MSELTLKLSFEHIPKRLFIEHQNRGDFLRLEFSSSSSDHRFMPIGGIALHFPFRLNLNAYSFGDHIGLESPLERK
ncbi:hypothetical protein [Sulfitobacter sp. M13]